MELIIAVLFFSAPVLAQSGIHVTPSPKAQAGTGGQTSEAVTNPSALAKLQNFYVDIRQYGARTTTISTTANCTQNSASMTVGTSSFVNNDGIVIYGCGPTSAIGQPTGLSVTPVEARTEPTPDSQGDPTARAGSSTFNYIVVGLDDAGGYSLPSSAASSTTGNALGSNTISVSSDTLSGHTETIVTSASNSLVAGALIHHYNSTNAYLSDYNNIASVTNGTTFTLNTGKYGNPASPTVGTGGSLGYFTGNRLSWTATSGATKYAICAQRPGDSGYNLVGMTMPVGVLLSSSTITWTDWGANFNLQSFPASVAAVGNSICTAASAGNDWLSTTVTSGGGTTVLTLGAAASQTVTGATAKLDAGPALAAAALVASNNRVPLYIPAGTLTVNTYQTIGAGAPLAIHQNGTLSLNETVKFKVSFWEGITASDGTQFEQSSRPIITGSGYPLMYAPGSSNAGPGIQHVALNPPGNGLGLIESGWAAYLKDFECSPSSNDYGSICLAVSPAIGAGIMDISDGLFFGGPAQTMDASWTPLVYFMPSSSSHWGNWSMKNVQFNRRGVEELAYGGVSVPRNIDWIRRQGGISPLFAFANFLSNLAFPMTARHLVGDTEVQPLLAFWTPSTAGSIVTTIETSDLEMNSQESGGIPQAISGNTMYVANQGAIPNGFATAHFGDVPGETGGYNAYEPGYESYTSLGSILLTNVTFPIDPPTLNTPTVTSGGSVSVGTHNICVLAIDWKNGVGSCSKTQSATTTSGNQTINLSWSAVPGAQGYAIQVDGLYAIGFFGQGRSGSIIRTNSYTMSANVANFAWSIAPQVNGAGFYVDASGATLPMLRLTNGQLKGELTLSPSGSLAIGVPFENLTINARLTFSTRATGINMNGANLMNVGAITFAQKAPDGSSSHPLRPVEVGTCTMSSGTCTVAWANSFTSTPLCFATWNGTGTLTGIVKAIPSTKTCIVTSSVRSDTAVMQIEGVANPN